MSGYVAQAFRPARAPTSYEWRAEAGDSLPLPENLDDPRTFLFGLENGKDVIDPAIGGNESRWINHSSDPNCEAIEDDDERIFIEALRDLRPGEELFYDYQLEVDEPITPEVKEESRCNCGAANCRVTKPISPPQRRGRR